MTIQNKRLIAIAGAVALLLSIPLIAMQFTPEVKWGLLDFIAAGVLLLGAGLTLELILRKVKTPKVRLVLVAILFAVFFLVWAELAVGIFGTPLAGS
ncbi:MAG TPA: hypothetical protein VD905_08155 [Flavobacteriales bacterium]|nr:hypothetical protein [Flavobacteriales bacterium]